MKRNLASGLALLLSITTLAFAAKAIEETAAVIDENEVMAPMFEVDPFWPQPLPNHWVLGSVVGVGIDASDNVYIIHRQAPLDRRTEIGAAQDPPTSECCSPTPYVLIFNP